MTYETAAPYLDLYVQAGLLITIPEDLEGYREE
jgi:hypothetical protein